jgi:membrane associated rhomboid family serine protease
MRYRGYQRFSETYILIIIAVCLVLFIASEVRNSLSGTLGLTPATWTSEPWTILTSIFMHSGILHILFNMLALYFLGRYLCMFIGDRWFLIVYFIGGIIGSFFFILLGPDNATVVGASGAIFAVGGALAVTVPQMKVIMFPIPIPMPLWVAIIGGFIIISFLPGVAWEAHLGGLVTGLAIGYYLRRRGPRRVIL